MNALDLYNDFGLAMKDISDIGSIWYKWINILNNFFYRVVYRLEPSQFETELNFAGSGTFTLPIDFENIRVGECSLWKLDSTGKEVSRILPGGRTSTYMSYRFHGNELIVSNVPANITWKLVYIPILSKITEPDDVLVLDEIWVESNIEALKRIYYEWDKNGQQETNSDSRLNRSLSELVASYGRGPKVAVMPE